MAVDFTAILYYWASLHVYSHMNGVREFTLLPAGVGACMPFPWLDCFDVQLQPFSLHFWGSGPGLEHKL